jgi:hypothetical protein
MIARRLFATTVATAFAALSCEALVYNATIEGSMISTIIDSDTVNDTTPVEFTDTGFQALGDGSRSFSYGFTFTPGQHSVALNASITRDSSASGNNTNAIETQFNTNGSGDLITFSNPGGGNFSVTLGLSYTAQIEVSAGSSFGNEGLIDYIAFFYQNGNSTLNRFEYEQYTNTAGTSLNVLDVADEVFTFSGTSGTLEIRNLFNAEARAFGTGTDPAGSRTTTATGSFSLFFKDITPGVTFTSATGATYSAVPEPGTISLLLGLASLCGLLLVRRHRRK